jgi:hypothetical protein
MVIQSVCLDKFNSQSQSHFAADSQYILVSSTLCGRSTRYCFLFKCLGLKCVVLSLWGALSDERPGLSFVSHSLVICLCVHLLFTFFFTTLPPTHTHARARAHTHTHTHTHIYTLYNTCNTYKASFSSGSV